MVEIFEPASTRVWIYSQSQSYIATDGRSISKSWWRAPSGAHDQIFLIVWQLRCCFCGAPSLTRERVCLLYMLLAHDSAVFIASESLGSRDHILLSLSWDFPFRRLLRLAGSRWRYSTPPPHGYDWAFLRVLPLKLREEPNRDHHPQQFLYHCALIRCCGNKFSDPLPGNGCPSTAESVTSGVFTEPLPINGHMCHNTFRNRDSSLGIVTDCMTGFRFPVGGIFFLLQNVQMGSGARPSFLSNRYGDYFQGVSRLGRGPDHSPPSNAEVKNGGAIPPFTIYLHGRVLV
jgi:hypothetical protein